MQIVRLNILNQLKQMYPTQISIIALANRLKCRPLDLIPILHALEAEEWVTLSQDQVSLAYLPINLTQLAEQLDQPWDTEVFFEIDSTNQFAKTQVTDSSWFDRQLYLANFQTHGQGRFRRRKWFNKPGRSIALSAVFRPNLPVAQLPLITQLAAATLVQIFPEIDWQIKWPNDLLIAGKKVSGILTEAVFQEEKPLIILGVGLNLNLPQNQFPDSLQNQATSLQAILGRQIEPTAVITSFLNCFTKQLAQWEETQQAAPFLDICRQHSALLNQEIWVHDHHEKRRAHADAIDEQGRLVVTFQGAHEQTTLVASEVSIRGLEQDD